MKQRGDPRPIGGYVMLLGAYSAAVGAAVVGLRSRKDRVETPRVFDFVLFALATQRLSRMVAKDSVTSPVRLPFARFQEPAGEGESNEEVVGQGARHAIGELVTCPFCVAQWAATGLVVGSLAAPKATTAAINTLAAVQMNDFLQLIFGLLRGAQ